MSYTDPCKGDCGANHWPDCSPDCSSRRPYPIIEKEKEKLALEKLERKKNKKICKKKGHDWEYGFIIYTCKRCGETTDY
jgi:hypothetical protein